MEVFRNTNLVLSRMDEIRAVMTEDRRPRILFPWCSFSHSSLCTLLFSIPFNWLFTGKSLKYESEPDKNTI